MRTSATIAFLVRVFDDAGGPVAGGQVFVDGARAGITEINRPTADAELALISTGPVRCSRLS